MPLFFVSGLVALVYEVLWMNELGLLFGNTAHATATTLAAFFLGLAAGGYFWGQRAAGLRNPLQTYGLLELAVALSVIGYFQILDAYHALYPTLFETFGNSHGKFVAVKFLLSMIILFPAAFFIGGTLPVMTQYLVQDALGLGRKVSVLYAVNTLGAAAGSVLAGFYLPPIFGFALSYKLALGCTALIGTAALILAGRRTPLCSQSATFASKTGITTREPVIPLPSVRAFALVSGFAMLCLEVLWTRMFAQVLQNSVYTFATILVIYLLALSAGAVLANWMMRWKVSPVRVLFNLFMAGALFVAATPFLFNAWTDGQKYIGAREGWTGYLVEVLKVEAAVMGIPVFVLGAIFPFLIKIAEPWVLSPGRQVGQLVALNTAGSIIGSLTAGFVILEAIGLWAGIRFVGVLYLVMAIYVLMIAEHGNRAIAILPMIGILLLVSVLDTARLPQVGIDPADEDESLVQVWESSSGTVAVVRRRESLKIKVNNYYTLGGTGSRELEEAEGYLPLLMHPGPESVFFLGLGTGISAGAVLNFPIRRLVVAELIPEVVQASAKYFSLYNNRLFLDPRVQVIAEDGRNILAGSREEFDVIIADLFVPWRSGAGSLYALEHYRTVRERLRENGLFMQWLPAYQLSKAEFGTIVRTMLEVFPQVTLWRGDFSSQKPILGVLAQPQNVPLAADALMFSDQNRPDFGNGVPALAHYVGNIGMLGAEWRTYPINSDDRPVIEYQSPITQRRAKNQEAEWLAGESLIQLMEHIQELQPPRHDSYLKNFVPEVRALSTAGMYLHRSQVLEQQGRLSAAKEDYLRYKELLREAAAKFP